MKTILSILSIAVLAFQTNQARADNGDVGLDKIRLYAGTWQSEIETFDTQYSKAAKSTKIIVNNCWRATNYYMCDQVVDHKSSALIVFTYDAKSDSYSSYAITTDGKDAPAGKLLIRGNIWTYPWQTDFKGKTVYVRVLNVFDSPTNIEYRKEASEDNVHWTLLAKGHEVKAQ